MESFYRQRALRLTLRNVAMTENVKTIYYGKNIAIFTRARCSMLSYSKCEDLINLVDDVE